MDKDPVFYLDNNVNLESPFLQGMLLNVQILTSKSVITSTITAGPGNEGLRTNRVTGKIHDGEAEFCTLFLTISQFLTVNKPMLVITCVYSSS